MNAQIFFWPIAERIPPLSVPDTRSTAHAAVLAADGSRHPAIATAVHVWAWDLDLPPGAHHWEILSQEETIRARRFVFPRDRDRYVRAHAVMRTLLSNYIGVPPTEVLFSSNSHGKPRIRQEQNPQSIRFNLSHSAGMAVLAVARGYEVGIDLELVRPIEREVAEGHFSPHELLTLQRLLPEKWLQGFYRCWTSKEALLKGEGLGLNLPLDAFDVDADPDRSPALLASRAPASMAPDWLLVNLQPGPDAVCTLAVRDQTAGPVDRQRIEPAVQCFAFSG